MEWLVPSLFVASQSRYLLPFYQNAGVKTCRDREGRGQLGKKVEWWSFIAQLIALELTGDLVIRRQTSASKHPTLTVEIAASKRNTW